ncbi:MAG: type II toxin-antitoxin system RelE/ParE family toxin [Candidatus Schekmanbacteria bacterium]|nr:type II toxin-antitoxin system RelE/ParE family toxin [Candidatus Schekmanbacteria bacterium]
MNYKIEIMPKAIKDIKRIPKAEAATIIDKINAMSNNLSGDVKKLTNFTPEYRLRVGNWRVLFEAEGGKIVIYRILHRREAYR